MSADRSEPKPFLSWCSVWLVLEWWPVSLLALGAASLGRWLSVPQWMWANGRDVTSKELWIWSIGAPLAIGAILLGMRLLVSSNVVGIKDTRTKTSSAEANSRDVSRRLYGASVLISLGLALLTVIQLATWYRDGWVPSLSPRVHGALDYRYFRSVDMRLQQVGNAIRDGELVLPQEIATLRRPTAQESNTQSAISSKLLVNELREYVLDWSEGEYARAKDIEGRKASLGMLAMMVDPDPQQLDVYLQWKAQEESRLELAVREAISKAELAKQEHESLAVQWREEQVSEKKSALANQVVAAEDRLNGHIREQLRLQGRLDVLANDSLDQRGLNREYDWLSLPTISRGGWLRVACSWLLASYLVVRLIGTALVSVASYLQLLQVASNRAGGGNASNKLGAGSSRSRGQETQPNDFGWFLITAGLWWLGLGW